MAMDATAAPSGGSRWCSKSREGESQSEQREGIAVEDDSVALLEGSGRKQEVARGSRRWSLRARRLLTATAAALGRGEEDDRGESSGGLGRAGPVGGAR